ncbi:MAG: hypothetical protein SFX18_12875 [Pirellulales bacterium]|nr:hypothetical protein [Pirellulales bacterium]
MFDTQNITVITRETRVEQLRAKWGTLGQARFVLESARARAREGIESAGSKSTSLSRGKKNANSAQAQRPSDEMGEFAFLEAEHQQYESALETLERDLNFGLPVKFLKREYVPTYDFSRTAVVIVIGQDGLVANTAKYVGELPVIGVNPDPQRIDGVLLPFTYEHLRPTVERVLAGRYQSRRVTLAECELSDGQKMLAFNDFFIGAKTHVSARYLLTAGEQLEAQSSSGVLVSTGAGSTGWLSSVFNMAAGVNGFFGKTSNERVQWSWEELRLFWAVREPFVSRTSQATLVAGELRARDRLRVESLMPENGVIFSDGIELDFLNFTSGTIAHIGVAGRQANLVVG